VAVTVDPADTKELDVQLVRLDGAEEAFFGSPPLMYLEFAEGDLREYRAKLHVPYDLAIPSPKMKVRFAAPGAGGRHPAAAGRSPPGGCRGRRTGWTTPLDLPTTRTSSPSPATPRWPPGVGTNQYVEAESEAFDVAPGTPCTSRSAGRRRRVRRRGGRPPADGVVVTGG
jgi:hypothetical protein